MLTAQLHLGPGQKQVSLLVIEQLLASGGGNCGGNNNICGIEGCSNNNSSHSSYYTSKKEDRETRENVETEWTDVVFNKGPISEHIVGQTGVIDKPQCTNISPSCQFSHKVGQIVQKTFETFQI